MAEAASAGNLTGLARPQKPWLNGLPRLIFVSDMGDALSEAISFQYLLAEVIDVVTVPLADVTSGYGLPSSPGGWPNSLLG